MLLPDGPALADRQGFMQRKKTMSTDPRVDWYGTDKDDDIDDFYGRNDLIYAGKGNDSLRGGIIDTSTTVFVGGEGRDQIDAVSHQNTLRYSLLTDSYRDATHSHADLIESFDVTQDTIDVAALGFSGLGDGHGDSLKLLYNAAQGLTYLKSFDSNADGQRFELVFKGDYSSSLTDANFQTLTAGTGFNDHLQATASGSETLMGYAGRDTLTGAAGQQRLDGGAGGDTLTGGAGADDFVFSSRADSVQNDGAQGARGRDLITDFSAADADLVDLSTLGFTGFGNGLDGTLKVTVNAAGDKTALQSLETDADGNRFEIYFSGDLRAELNRDTVIFGNTSADKVITSLTRDDQDILGTDKADHLTGGAAHDQILGFAGDDTLVGGAGNDAMAGGLGADTLTGGVGNDDFVFYSIGESYRTATEDHSDLITDYAAGDHLFALDLGFSKIGDGSADTLKLDYDAAKDQTYLHALTADDQGRFFQVTLAGKHTDVSIALDGLYVDQAPIEIIGVDPTGHAPV